MIQFKFSHNPRGLTSVHRMDDSTISNVTFTFTMVSHGIYTINGDSDARHAEARYAESVGVKMAMMEVHSINYFTSDK